MTEAISAFRQDPSTLKIAIVSDLHVFTQAEPGKAPSYLRTEEIVNNPLESPLMSLELLVRKEELQADLLFCPGDLCDRADPQALQFAWRKVTELGLALRSSAVVATTGNHDVDSRHSRQLDTWAELKLLTNYPIRDESLANEYWAKHFTIWEQGDSDCRIVTLNSSAHHGQVEIEKNHGRINEATLRQLEARLKSGTPPTTNLLLCHHHPQQHSEILLGEDDWMRTGQPLLDLLANPAFGSWVVIHGHKHHPKLTYASGGGNSPVILACGSLAAHLFPQLSSRTKNQFHLIHLDLQRSRTHGASGFVQSWSFSFGLGWLEPEGALCGLPHRAGFGYRGSPRELASRVARKIAGMMEWLDVIRVEPDLAFLIPEDLNAIKYYLRTEHCIRLWEDGTVVRKALRE